MTNKQVKFQPKPRRNTRRFMERGRRAVVFHISPRMKRKAKARIVGRRPNGKEGKKGDK